MANFIQLFIAGIAIGLIYALCALGVNIIFKATKVLLVAAPGMILIPAFFGWTFLVGAESLAWAPLAMVIGTGFWPPLAILLTFAASAGVGWVLYRFGQHPLIGQPVLSLVICTTMMWFLLRGLTLTLWGGNPKMYPGWLAARGVFDFEIVSIPQITIISLIASSLAVAGLLIYFRYARGGLAMRVTAEDHIIAEILGVKVTRVFAMAWVISMLLFAVAGFMTGAITGISQDLDIMGVYGIIVALLGGLESFTGAIVGGLLIGLIQTMTGGYLGEIIGGGISEAAPFIFMLLFMYWKPYGMWGLVRIERI